MKVLLINDNSTPGGGSENVTLMLLDGLRRKGHDARLFASSAATCAGQRFADYECYGTTSRFRTLSQTANFSAFFKLKSLLKEFQPDVIHAHMFMTQLSPLIIPLFRKIPSLYHVNLYDAICPLATKCLPGGDVCHFRAGWVCHKEGCLPLRAMPPQMLRMHLFRRWCSSFRLFVAASQMVKRFLVEERIGPVEVITNGITIAPKRPPLCNPPTVSFAGHLIPRKGVDVLIKAFAKVVSKVPDSKLLIAGHGSEEDKLIQMTQDLGISKNVTMLGWLAQPELGQRLSSAWVHVTPSIWEEPFGITTLEAMMRGTTVVASRVGGQLECVHEWENGFLVPPNDPERLFSVLLRILRDRHLAETMGDRGRRIAMMQFSDSKFIDRFVDVYDRLLETDGA